MGAQQQHIHNMVLAIDTSLHLCTSCCEVQKATWAALKPVLHVSSFKRTGLLNMHRTGWWLPEGFWP